MSLNIYQNRYSHIHKTFHVALWRSGHHYCTMVCELQGNGKYKFGANQTGDIYFSEIKELKKTLSDLGYSIKYKTFKRN